MLVATFAALDREDRPVTDQPDPNQPEVGSPQVGVAAATASTPTATEPERAGERPAGDVRAAPERFTIAVTGDILLHMPVTDRAAAYGAELGTGARDFRPMFDRVRPLLSAADLALCHLETPLSPDGSGLRGNPVFSSAPEIAAAIAAAGFDGCSTASNHSFDGGDTGVTATLEHLDRAGVRHAGSARSAVESTAPTLYRVGRYQVAHLAYTSFLNGAHPNESWRINVVTPEQVDRVAADARRAREAGADFVIVSVHAGNEFVHEPSRLQVDLADAITRIAEVDVMVGHHAHVVQPAEIRNGKWVVYGLGNFLSNQHLTNCCPRESQDGVIVRITVEPGEADLRVVGVDATPTWVERDGYVIVPAALGAIAPVGDDDRDVFVASRERTLDALHAQGAPVGETPVAAILGRATDRRG